MTEKTDLERARDIAVQLENENARLEAEHTEFVLKAGDRIGQAEALAELRRRDLDDATARAERAEQQLAQAREVLADLHPRGIDLPNHCRCGELYPCATIRALGAVQQPAPAGGGGDR